MGITSVLIIDGLTGCLYKHLRWGPRCLTDVFYCCCCFVMLDTEAHADGKRALP